MKRVIFVLVLLVLATMDSETFAAEPCDVMCSARCVQYARRILLDCEGVRPPPNDSEIIRACKDSFFGSDELECAQHARSAEAVRACVEQFYGSDELTCAKSAISRGVVVACTELFYGSDELTCAVNARSEAQVRACVEKFYGSDELRCVVGN